MQTSEKSPFKIRPITAGDFRTMQELWQRVGFELSLSDSDAELHRFLERNPDTSLVGETSGKIIGTVLGGFDGRRGIVHHLAVDPAFQGRGYGKAMMAELEGRFRRNGVVKVNFWVKADNTEVIGFYNAINYESRDLITMSKVMRTK